MNEKDIIKKLSELDSHFPETLGDKDVLWTEIENRVQKTKRLLVIKYSLRIAATLTLIFIAPYLWNAIPTQDEVTLAVRQEIMAPQDNFHQEPVALEKEAFAFINAQCVNSNPKCKSTEFKTLMTELEDVGLEAKSVLEEMNKFGNDPGLIKAQIAVENHKAYIINELIQILRS